MNLRWTGRVTGGGLQFNCRWTGGGQGERRSLEVTALQKKKRKIARPLTAVDCRWTEVGRSMWTRGDTGGGLEITKVRIRVRVSCWNQ